MADVWSMWRTLVRIVRCVVGAALTFGLHVIAAGQGGSPMITEDTGTTEWHRYEINTAFAVRLGAGAKVYAAPFVDLNYGITKNAQFTIGVPYLVLRRGGERSIAGLGNTNVGVKYRFREESEKRRVSMSIFPQLALNNPTSSARRGLVNEGPELLMPLQWETAFGKWGAGGEVGYRFKRGEDEVIYGVVVGREFKRFELLAELHGTGGYGHLGASEIVCNFGTRVALSKHAAMQLSAGRSARPRRDPRFIAYAGMQWTF